MAVEQPAYHVELDRKPFQVREYPRMVLATVQVSGTRDAAVSSGFRLLANYIFGGNHTDSKIAMTAPVLQTLSPTAQGPTAQGPTTAGSSALAPATLGPPTAGAPPGGASAARTSAASAETVRGAPPAGVPPDQSRWAVTFIMPQGYTLQTLPPPNDPRVHFVDDDASRMAVISFSGFWTDANLQSHQQQLVKFMQEMHLKPLSGPIYAFYDPPWTPWFWRTNEVQYRLAP